LALALRDSKSGIAPSLLFFSPLLWEDGGYVYIPAESVYAVFEVKQDHSLKHIKAAGQKAASVRRRLRTEGEFGWLKGTAKKKLFTALGGLLIVDSDLNCKFPQSQVTFSLQSVPSSLINKGSLEKTEWRFLRATTLVSSVIVSALGLGLLACRFLLPS